MVSEKQVIGADSDENLLQMDLVKGIFELRCFETPLTFAKLDIMGMTIAKAGIESWNIVVAVHDHIDIAKLKGFMVLPEDGELIMRYRDVRVVRDPKRVPPTEVHFRLPEGELIGKLVELKPLF